MKRVKLMSVALVSGFAAGCASYEQSEYESPLFAALGGPGEYVVPEESVRLFDGLTLDGWVQRGGAASFRVEDGAIVGTTVPHSPSAFLCTKNTYRDFVLSLEFKVDPRVNSGVQFRSLSTPDFENGRVHGYQAEIDPSERSWTGGLYDEGRRGWLVNLESNAPGRKAFKQGEWNQMIVCAYEDKFTIAINYELTVEAFRDGQTREGFIALQVNDAGEQAEPMEVRWRNITLAPLVAN